MDSKHKFQKHIFQPLLKDCQIQTTGIFLNLNRLGFLSICSIYPQKINDPEGLHSGFCFHFVGIMEKVYFNFAYFKV